MGHNHEKASCCLYLSCVLSGLVVTSILWGILVWILQEAMSLFWIVPVAINCVTLLINIIDKCIAMDDASCCWRIPEAVLYLLVLCGGGPAGALSFCVACHKKSKALYQRVFLAVSIISNLALGAIFIFAVYRAV